MLYEVITRVGAPGVEDTHRPDSARLDPFDTDVRTSEVPALAPAMALRAVRPPRPVRVQARMHPDRVDGVAVVHCAGPWRLFGEWWGERCFARDYFDVELADGALCRLYRNLPDDTWYLDGVRNNFV